MSSQTKRLFPCSHDGCLSVFKKSAHLLRHELIHSDERPYPCTITGCSASFRSPFHVKRHEAAHSKEKNFKCHFDDCQVACLTEWNLKRHIKRTHDGPFKCKKCEKDFKKNKLLQQHISLEHKSSTVCCDFPGCNAIFAVPSKLKHHMKMHQRGYICSVKGCSQKFQLWSECRQHAALCKIKEKKCEFCDKVFTEIHNLRAHEKIHGEEREVYQCSYKGCGRFYTKQYNLKVHVQSFHQNIRPFICPKQYCNKSFHFQHLLRNHLEMHALKDTSKDVVPKKRRRTRRLLASTISNITGYIPELWGKLTPAEIKSYVYGDNDSVDMSDSELKDKSYKQLTCTPMTSSDFVSSTASDAVSDTSVKSTGKGMSSYSSEETLTAVTTEKEVSDEENTMILEPLTIEEANQLLNIHKRRTSPLTQSDSLSSSPSIGDEYGSIRLRSLNVRLKSLASKQKQNEALSTSSNNITDSCHVQSMTESESESEMSHLKMQHCVA